MESTGHVSVSVPLRAGKKMKKRKELDALVANSVTKRSCVTSKRGQGQAGGGISSQDQLLSESTDDQEYWIAAGAAKRPRARMARKRACTSLFRTCSIILMLACVLASTTVLWFFIDVREQISALRSELDRVVASSQGVPDALQKCHTISKSLQNNQSLIITQIGTLKMHLENYNKNVSEMQIRLNLIQEKLHNVPEYVDVPQELKQVSSSIANLGSQIKDITNTVATLKSSKERLETTNNALIQNITKLKNSVNYLQNQSQTPLSVNTENSGKIENIFKIIDAMKVNLTNVNSTLSSNILWIRDDLKLYRKNVEIISNVGQNMSARVSTLEGLCGKSVTQNILSTNIKGVYDELKNITNNIERQALQINDIQMQVFQLSQNSSELSLAINTLNQSLDEKDKSQKQQQIEQEQEQHHQRQMQMQMQQALFNERQIMATSQTESPSSNTVIKEGEKHMATATATATATLMPTPSRSSQMPPTSAPVSSTPPPIQLKDSAKNPTAKPSILTP